MLDNVHGNQLFVKHFRRNLPAFVPMVDRYRKSLADFSTDAGKPVRDFNY